MIEVWKSVIGYKGLYEVSNKGRIKSVEHKVQQLNKIGKPRIYTVRERIRKLRSYGSYVYVDFIKDGKFTTHMVHRLVLLAFVGPCPVGMETRHLNGDKGDNWLRNLKWGTHIENEADKRLHGYDQNGENNPNAKLTKRNVLEIRNSNLSIEELAIKFNVSKGAVHLVKQFSTWS